MHSVDMGKISKNVLFHGKTLASHKHLLFNQLMWDVYISPISSPPTFSPRSLSLAPSTKDWSAKNFITLGNHVNQLDN